jgi:dolichol-phosphate mannosyltransferase
MGVLWVLASPAVLGWNVSVSKVVAAEVAIFNNFLWNDCWTFHGLGTAQSDWRRRGRRLGKFNLICLAGIVWSVLLLNAQVYGLGINVYVANSVAIVIVSFWNFWMNLRFGWGGKRNHGQLTTDRLPRAK